jgi:hypothetical protein
MFFHPLIEVANGGLILKVICGGRRQGFRKMKGVTNEIQALVFLQWLPCQVIEERPDQDGGQYQGNLSQGLSTFTS